ncbi:MAG TPA: hypothetical protein VFA20_19685 [Myxococcaceae bacterium]|nr:hypothetical protein [Myxococcaceae bacterium]
MLTGSKARLWVSFCGVAFALLSSAFTPVSSDLGWVLAFGRDVVERGQWITTNVQSFTEPAHRVFMYEWGFGTVAFALHHAFGAAGVIGLKWLLVAVAVTLMGLTTGRLCKPAVQLVLLLAAVRGLWISFELPRAQLVTFALLAAVVLASTYGTRGAMRWCVPLVAAGVNSHGGFLAVAGLLGALTAATWAEGRLGWTKTNVSLLDVVGVSLASLAAACLNPYGPRMLVETLTQVSDPSRFLIREWLPGWHWGELFLGEKLGYGALALSCAVSIAFLPRRQLRYWLLLAAAAVTSASAIRHLRMAPILLLPVLAAALDAALGKVPAQVWERVDRPVAWLAGAVGVASLGQFVWWLPVTSRFEAREGPSPANAIAVMKLNGIKGKVWNDYDWGGALLWCVPESTVAADGRHTIAYSPRTIEDNIMLGHTADDPALIVQRSGAELVLLPPSDPALPRLAQVYGTVYCDPGACLLSKVPEHLQRSRSGLRLPKYSMNVSDYFQDRTGPDAALSDQGQGQGQGSP